MKSTRYYKIIDGMAFVYDGPFADSSMSVSIVPVDGLKYYHNNFNLQKAWG